MTNINKICSTPQECMDSFFKHIQTAQEGSFNAKLAFRNALSCLLGLHNCLESADTVLKGSSILRQFRETSSAKLVKFENELSAYSDITLFMAEGANDNRWYQLCMRRSVIQVLVSDYARTPVSEYIDLEDVSDLDQELRRVGLEQGPVPEEDIPYGIPMSHWWWRYPENSVNDI